MDAEISQSEQWLRFIAWLEDNWRRVAAIGAIVIVIGIVVAFVMWQGAQKQRHASNNLSLLLVGPKGASGEALLQFVQANEGTVAATRAKLLAAGALFTEGKFQEAQVHFEGFLAEEGAGPLTSKARFGIAACKEAQGQAEAALIDYKGIVENPGSGNVVPQARFALARLYLEQGQVDLARTQYEELASVPGSSLAAQARLQLSELPPGEASRPMTIPSPTPAVGVSNQP